MTPGRRELRLTRQVERGIAALPARVRVACKNVLRQLAAGDLRGKKLKGELSELRPLRLGQAHRLLYRETATEIQVVDVGPRGDIYKR